MSLKKCPPFWLLLISIFLAACSPQETTWDRVQSSGVLRIGLDPTYPPFEFYDGSSLYGIDVDLAEAIAAEKSLTTEFSHFGFDGLYDALATEQVDVLISALGPDIARTKDFSYSQGYIDSGLVLVSRADQPYQDPAALDGRHLAVELGAAGHVEATDWQRQIQSLTVSTLDSSEAALDAVAIGQADAAVVDYVTFRLFNSSNTETTLTAVQITSEPYAIVVRRKDADLLSAMNEALTQLRETGRLEAIIDRWFSS